MGETLSSVKPCLSVRPCLPWCVRPCHLFSFIWRCLMGETLPYLALCETLPFEAHSFEDVLTQETGDHCCPDSPLRITCDGSAHRLCTNLPLTLQTRAGYHPSALTEKFEPQFTQTVKFSNCHVLCPLSCCHFFHYLPLFSLFPMFSHIFKGFFLTPFGSRPPNFSVILDSGSSPHEKLWSLHLHGRREKSPQEMMTSGIKHASFQCFLQINNLKYYFEKQTWISTSVEGSKNLWSGRKKTRILCKGCIKDHQTPPRRLNAEGTLGSVATTLASPGGGETVHHCGSLNAGDPVERAPRQKIIRTIIMIFSVIGIIIIIIFVNM